MELCINLLFAENDQDSCLFSILKDDASLNLNRIQVWMYHNFSDHQA